MERVSTLFFEVAQRVTPNHLKHFLIQAALCGVAVVVAYVWKRRSLAGFIGYCLPPALFAWGTLTDFGYAVVRKLVFPLLMTPVATGAAIVAPVVYHRAGAGTAVPAPWWLIELIALGSFLVAEFTYYWIHRWHHTVPLLWEFHKIHHSARFLTFLTAPREHLVEVALNNGVPAVATGVFIGATSRLCGVDLVDTGLAAIDIAALVYFLCMGTLRHTHFYVGFGPVIETIFISPAMHQIHHSAHEHHLDRNFGFNMALWDRLFGSHVYATDDQTVRFGLYHAEQETDYDTVWKLWFTPFLRIGRRAYCAMTHPATVDAVIYAVTPRRPEDSAA